MFVEKMCATLCVRSLVRQGRKEHCFIHTEKQNVLLGIMKELLISCVLSFGVGCKPQNFLRFSLNSYIKAQMLTLSKSKYLEAGNLYKNIFPLDLANTMSSARLHPGEFWPTM